VFQSGIVYVVQRTLTFIVSVDIACALHDKKSGRLYDDRCRAIDYVDLVIYGSALMQMQNL
jgi:hypothetical protein